MSGGVRGKMRRDAFNESLHSMNEKRAVVDRYMAQEMEDGNNDERNKNYGVFGGEGSYKVVG